MNKQMIVMDFLKSKGVDTHQITGDSVLMQHIQSVDFMELIITAETVLGRELDLESVEIDQISSVAGFVGWLEGH